MRDKLTDRFAASAPPGLHWGNADRRAPKGFLLRVTQAGARAWCLNYRVKVTGRERRLNIGDTSTWPIAMAIERAAELRRMIDAGGDPLGDLQDKRAEPTVAELVKRFEEEALSSRAARTAAEYKAMLDKHVLPAIGRVKVSAVDPDDIAKLHAGFPEGRKRRADAIVTVASVVWTGRC
jgi:hypothetical protein